MMFESNEMLFFVGRAAILVVAFLTFAVVFGRWRRAGERDMQRLLGDVELLAQRDPRPRRPGQRAFPADLRGWPNNSRPAHSLSAAAAGNGPRGYELALRLARSGAAIEDIAETSGVTRPEAQLLARLHGPEHCPHENRNLTDHEHDHVKLNHKGPSDTESFAFVQSLAKELSSGRIDMPSFPDVAARVRQVLADEFVSSAQVVRVVSSEAALAGKLLMIANSAAINPGGARITEIKTAVTRIGLNMVRSATLAFAMEQLRTVRGSEGPARPDDRTVGAQRAGGRHVLRGGQALHDHQSRYGNARRPHALHGTPVHPDAGREIPRAVRRQVDLPPHRT